MKTIKDIFQWILDNGDKRQHKMYTLNSIRVIIDVLNDKADNFILIMNAHNLEEFFSFDPKKISESEVLEAFKSAPILLYKYDGKEVIRMQPTSFSNDYLNWQSATKHQH